MKDSVLYFLFSLQKKSLVSRVYGAYYEWAIRTVSLALRLCPFVDHAYLKGSYEKEYFVPVMSDLDFFIVGRKTEFTQSVLKSIFRLIHYPFPIVSDYDFYTYDEMDFLRNLGDLKFLSASNWKVIKGDSFGFSYRYHPRKFYLDIVNEIYFQFEWLFRNLQKRKVGDRFRSISIQRQYDKITDILNYLHEHPSYIITKRKLKPSLRWASYTNEEIIFKFNKLLHHNYKFQELSRIILREFADRNIEGVLQQEYFRKELKIIKDINFKYDQRLHYFTIENFKFFYFSGCIDSYLLFDRIQSNTDSLTKAFLESQYYSKLLEGRINIHHNSDYLNKKRNELNELKKYICNTFVVYETPPHNFFGSNVILSVSSDQTDPNLDPHQCLDDTLFPETIDYEFFHVCLNHGINESSIYQEKKVGKKTIQSSVLHLYRQHLDENINHEPNLFQIGVNWCFGAAQILITDNPFKIDSAVLQCAFEDVTQDSFYHLVQLSHKNDSYAWSGPQAKWSKIQLGSILSWGRYLNELTDFLLTGRLREKSQVKTYLHRELVALDNKDNHVEIRDGRTEPKELKKESHADQLFPLIKDYFIRNQWGFWEVKEEKKKLWYQIGYLMQEENSYDFLTFMNSLSDSFEGYHFEKILKGSGNNSVSLEFPEGGYAAILDYSEHSVVIQASKVRTRVLLRKIQQVEVEFNGNYYLNLEFFSQEKFATDYVDIKIFAMGHEGSGTHLYQTGRDYIYIKDAIVYLPEGKSNLLIELELTLKPHQRLELSYTLLDAIEASLHRSIKKENISVEEIEISVFGLRKIPFLIQLHVKDWKPEYYFYIESDSGKFPTSYDYNKKTFNCYGIFFSEDRVSDWFKTNIPNYLVNHFDLYQVYTFFYPDLVGLHVENSKLAFSPHSLEFISREPEKIIFKVAQPSESVEVVYQYELERIHHYGLYMVDFLFYQPNAFRNLAIEVWPDNEYQKRTKQYIRANEPHMVALELDEYKKYISFKLSMSNPECIEHGFEIKGIKKLDTSFYPALRDLDFLSESIYFKAKDLKFLNVESNKLIFENLLENDNLEILINYPLEHEFNYGFYLVEIIPYKELTQELIEIEAWPDGDYKNKRSTKWHNHYNLPVSIYLDEHKKSMTLKILIQNSSLGIYGFEIKELIKIENPIISNIENYQVYDQNIYYQGEGVHVIAPNPENIVFSNTIKNDDIEVLYRVELDKSYGYGVYFLEFLLHKAIEQESISIEIWTNSDIERLLRAEKITNQKLVVPILLDEYKKSFTIRFAIEKAMKLQYGIELVSIKKMGKADQQKYRYMQKMKQNFNIPHVYAGFYKFVFFFEDQPTGVVEFEAENFIFPHLPVHSKDNSFVVEVEFPHEVENLTVKMIEGNTPSFIDVLFQEPTI